MRLYNDPNPSIGQELLNVPMGDMIREMALAIAESQVQLDENSIEVAEMMGGLKTITDENTGEVTFSDSRVFFGTEQILLSSALDLYNDSLDEDLKNQIFATYIDGKRDTDIDPVTSNPITDPSVKLDNGRYVPFSEAKNVLVTVPRRMSMMELGFTPTFYQFVDTIIEVKIAIKYSREGSSTANVKTNTARVTRPWRKGMRITTSQVNATYSSKFSYSAEGSSLLRTKLVPIPPPQVLEDRIRLLMQSELQETV